MASEVALRALVPVNRPSVADQVFDSLQESILNLELPPGARISEVDVATQMGVSRQPVRDAFYRLSKLGFLVIRPQRSTTISLISETAVLHAQYLRNALEVETVRSATETLTEADFIALDALLAAQNDAHVAQNKILFHRLDDQFHREICTRGGVGFAWDFIAENKVHMDRVRMLSLSFASRQALDDHIAILERMKARDAAGAADLMRVHLSRIRGLIDRIRADENAYFDRDATA